MILKIFPDECAVCHQSNPNPLVEIKVALVKYYTEFDSTGHRYVTFKVDDTEETVQQYQKLIAEGEIKPKR